MAKSAALVFTYVPINAKIRYIHVFLENVMHIKLNVTKCQLCLQRETLYPDH